MNDTTTTQTEQPGTSPRMPPIVRPRQNRVIAGVAAGLAARLGIGTGWVRAAFVITTFFGGAGLLLYIVGWLAIPAEGEPQSIAASKVTDLEDSSRWVGIALIAVGGVLVLSLTGAVRGELVWAGALLLVGVLLYRGEFPELKRPPATATDPLPPDPPLPPLASPVTTEEAGEAASGEQASGEQGDEESVATNTDGPPPVVPEPPPLPPAPTAPRSRPPRSVLGRLTLAVMLVTVAVIALLDNAGVVEPGARHYLGAVVGIAGLGLLVGARWGRSRALIALGVLLLPFLLVASVVRVPLSGTFGEKDFRPTTVVEIQDEYRLGAGDLSIDLSLIDFAGETVEFEATVGAGRLTVIVPALAEVSIDGRVGFGELDVLGDVRSGIGREITIAASSDAVGFVNMEIEAGFGQVLVIRASR